MLLDTTTRKIQVLTDATATTTESPVVVDYVDLTSASGQAISSNTVTNGATAVDVVAAPASGVQRRVVEMSIENADTVNHTYTVRYNDNGTTRVIVKLLVLPGQTVFYNTQTGWVVPAGVLFGGNKASFRAHKNGTDQTGIVTATLTKITFPTEVWDTGGYYDAPNSKWTPPAGPISIVASINFTGGVVANSTYQFSIYKNGAQYQDWLIAQNIAGANTCLIASLIELCNGTDYYEIYAYGDGTGNKTASGSTLTTYFSGTAL